MVKMKKRLIFGLLFLTMLLPACSLGDGSESLSEKTQEPSTEREGPAELGDAEETDAEETGNRDESGDVDSGKTDAAETDPEEASPEEILFDNADEVKNARLQTFEELCEAAKLDEERSREIEQKAMTFGSATMKYTLETVGEEGSDGYPVYITLHGGGGVEKEFNDDQWFQMQQYYLDSVEDGIYIAVRGVRDTWDTHFNPESYPLYERLIENLSIYYHIDTNRIYLLGYSAGGDGVYQISARLADRFGAVNMSAGHPNGVNLTNLYNLPIALQCGEKDTAYDRDLETAKYGGVLSELAVRFGRDGQPEGYTHRVFLHKGKEHWVIDNDPKRSNQVVLSDPGAWLENGSTETEKVSTNAVDFVTAYTRDPLPERIVWDLSVRAPQSDTETFYWLRAPKSVTTGIVVVSYDRETNTITVEQNTANGPVYAMVNDEMLDLFSDITVATSDGQQTANTVTPSLSYIQKTIEERWDKNMIFAGELELPACDPAE